MDYGEHILWLLLQNKPAQQTCRRPGKPCGNLRARRETGSCARREGKLVKELAALPLAEDIPIAFNSCRKGPRSISWRDDRPHELTWMECQVCWVSAPGCSFACCNASIGAYARSRFIVYCAHGPNAILHRAGLLASLWCGCPLSQVDKLLMTRGMELGITRAGWWRPSSQGVAQRQALHAGRRGKHQWQRAHPCRHHRSEVLHEMLHTSGCTARQSCRSSAHGMYALPAPLRLPDSHTHAAVEQMPSARPGESMSRQLLCRANGIAWGSDDLALLYQSEWKSRRSLVHWFRPGLLEEGLHLWQDRNYEDAYNGEAPDVMACLQG